ncbi:hypothetical protein AZG84_000404 [Escherichia coli]|nr:hypothetical protein [Escherichia coli]
MPGWKNTTTGSTSIATCLPANRFKRGRIMTTDEQLFSVTDKGIRTPSGFLDFDEALEKLDEGVFDEPLIDGISVLCGISEALDKGLIEHSHEQSIKFWRWMYTAAAFFEILAKNGGIEVPDEEGGTDYGARYVGKNGEMVIYPIMLRILMQQDMETALMQALGYEEGIKRSIELYSHFLSEPIEGKHQGLSAHGWKALEMIMDPLIDEFKEGKKPEPRVIH